MMFAALIALYEISLLVAKIVLKRRIARDEEEMDELEEGSMSITKK